MSRDLVSSSPHSEVDLIGLIEEAFKMVDYHTGVAIFLWVGTIATLNATAEELPSARLQVEQVEIKAELETLPRLIPSAQVHGQLGFYGFYAANQQITVDLGEEIAPDEIILFPGRLPVDSGDADELGFPPEVEVEISPDLSFSEAMRIGRWEEDSPGEGAGLRFLRFPVSDDSRISGRYLRLRIFGTTPEAEHRGRAFAFSEIVVLVNGRNAALGRPVQNRGGFENAPRWTGQNLTDGYLWCLTGNGVQRSESNGFHSAIEERLDRVKWVEVDLGEALLVDEIHLIPAHPRDFASMAGFGFPPRFRILGYNADGQETVLIDFTADGFPNPGADAVMFPIEPTPLRRIRIEASELWKRNNDYLFALAELQVWSGGENVALGGTVSAFDEVGWGLWSIASLTDGYSSQRNLLSWRDWLDGLSRRFALEKRSAEIATILDERAFRSQKRWVTGATVAVMAIVVGFVVMLWFQRRQAAGAREALRQRIAHDLHDELGASLSHLALQSDLARRQLPEDEPVRNRLTQLSESARDTLDNMRDVIWLLAPETDSWRGFQQRLETIAERLLEGLDHDFEVEGEIPDGKPGIEWARECVLIFKEAITNARKHAEARKVLVTLAWEQRKLQLVVCDDGRGFDGADSLSQSGLGIKNLQRRASALDGNLSIESKPGAGTSVRLDVPLPRKRKSR